MQALAEWIDSSNSRELSAIGMSKVAGDNGPFSIARSLKLLTVQKLSWQNTGRGAIEGISLVTSLFLFVASFANLILVELGRISTDSAIWRVLPGIAESAASTNIDV